MNNDFIIKRGILERYTGTEENVVIPDDVEEIGEAAFSGARVKSVTANGDLRKIGYRAFHPCQTLESFTVNGKISIIGALAFYHCNRLTEFNVTESSKKIGPKAFAYCGKLRPELTKLLECTGHVGDEAFTGTATEHVTINSCHSEENLNYKITANWGKNAFAHCDRLEKAVFAEGTECIAEGMFEGCEALTSVTFLGKTNILAGAFKSCHSLKEIEIKSDSVIHQEAFSDCTGLENVRFTGDESFTLGKRVFYGCTGLTELVLPEGLRYVPEGAFACCLNLKSVVIPDSVDYAIQRNSFRCCISLKSVKLGENVRFIGEEAFFGCRNLTSINIPDSVKKIGDNAFAECDKLSLSVNPAILKPGSDIFGSTYGIDNADEIGDSDVEAAILRDKIREKLNRCGKIVFYDCETTGLDAEKSELIRVTAEKYNVKYSVNSNTYTLIEREDYDIFIRPVVPLSDDVVNITGITNEMLADKPLEKEAFEKINAIFSDVDLIVGHCTEFELPFFKALYERCRNSFDSDLPIHDTHILVKALVPKDKIRWHYSLKNVSAFFGAAKGDNDAAKVRKSYIGLAGIAGISVTTA